MYQNFLNSLLNDLNNDSIQMCRNVAYAQYANNYNLELNIFENNCFEISTTTTKTSTTCTIDYSPFLNLLTPSAVVFDDALNSLLAEESQYFMLDTSAQETFASNQIDSSCSDLLNQLVSPVTIHTEFTSCVLNVSNKFKTGLNTISQSIMTVFSNCGINVSILK